MWLNGIDVSRYNADSQIDLWLPKVDYGIVCASQGTYLVAPAHDHQVGILRAAGKRVGHYHYADITSGGVSSAKYFLDHAQPRPGDTIQLDWEPFGQSLAGSPQASTFVREFAVTCWNETKTWTGLYSEDFHLSQLVATMLPGDLAVARNLPLWKAGVNNRYLPGPSAPPFQGSIYGWPAVTMWQWSDLPLDLDVFYGDGRVWDLLALPHPASVPPVAPVPVSPSVSAKGSSMSHIEIVGGSNWREIPIPNDGHTYAVSCAFGGGPQTAGVEFLTFERMVTVETPAQVSRSGSWPAWQRDVPGRITLAPNEGCISIRFHGTADQTLSIELYQIA